MTNPRRMLMATAGVSAAGELASGPGTLWSWGLNDKGQIGNGNKLNVSSPVQIGSATNWTKVVRTGRHSLSLNSSGKIYSWGYNALGGLGHNNTTYLSSPVQVGSLTTWSKITGSERSSMAIKTDGTLWTWGGGSYGQTGHGDAVHRSSPVQVGSLTNWSTVTCGHAGTVLAVKTDGTLWGWGNNASGSVGNGTILHVSSPTQIGSLTNWGDISIGKKVVIAIKTDGTAWSWGYGNQGALALSNNISVSSPTQIGALTTWAKGSAVSNKGSFLVSTNGTLWLSGALILSGSGVYVGEGYTRTSSPTQLGALTNWDTPFTTGQGNTVFVGKTDGTMWVWGACQHGSTGLGNVLNVSSPTQIGSDTLWTDELSSAYGALAIKVVA